MSLVWNITVVSDLTALSKVAVTATVPTLSATVVLASDTVSVVGSGLGCTVTATAPTCRLEPYLVSEPEAAWLIDDAPVRAPRTVKVCGVFQLEVEKVRVAGVTVALAGVPLVAVMVTGWVGWVSSTTVYVPVVSTTTLSVSELSVTPAVSSSVTVTVAAAEVRVPALAATVNVSVSSAIRSSVMVRDASADLSPIANAAVKVAGTVKSEPSVAVPSVVVKVTVVASSAGWSSVAVNVSEPTSSATETLAGVTVTVVGGPTLASPLTASGRTNPATAAKLLGSFAADETKLSAMLQPAVPPRSSAVWSVGVIDSLASSPVVRITNANTVLAASTVSAGAVNSAKPPVMLAGAVRSWSLAAAIRLLLSSRRVDHTSALTVANSWALSVPVTASLVRMLSSV